METLSLFFSWYYKDLPKKAYQVWRNFLWFILYYFSIKELLLSFFSPWRRYSMPYSKGFDIKQWWESFTFNVFSRFMGMMLRTFLILFGLLIEILVFVIGVLFFVIWPVFPFLLIGAFALGFSFL